MLTSGLSEAAGAGVAVTRDVLEEHKARWLGELRAGAVPETLDAAALAQLRLEAPDAAPYGGGEALGALRLVSPPEVRTTDSAVMLVARVRGEAGEPVWIARAAPDTLAARALSLARAARLLQALRLERSSLERAELLALYGSSRLAVNLAALAGPPAGGALWCDRESLKRALVNLVDNALAAQQTSAAPIRSSCR